VCGGKLDWQCGVEVLLFSEKDILCGKDIAKEDFLDIF